MNTIVHLTSSRFLGGPERQMLGLAENLRRWRTVFASFAENGHSLAFLSAAKKRGFEAHALANDTPHLLAAAQDVRQMLHTSGASVLVCHGYKANALGVLATIHANVKCVAVSRGWTGESLKIKSYEVLDRRILRWMDRVVCVSQSQAIKARRAGVAEDHLIVIRNAIDTKRFQFRDYSYRARLVGMFRSPPRIIVGAAGRLSPEKGFDVLIRAAARIAERDSSIGLVLFGEGAHRAQLERQIAVAHLEEQIKLVGFHSELDQFFPHFDILALPSFTEGLPNVVLEAFAAGVPVVATAVGGVPEVVDDGVSGYLIPSGDAAALADRLIHVAGDDGLRRAMGCHGRRRVERDFSFAAQAKAYEDLFVQLTSNAVKPSWSVFTSEDDVFAHSDR